MQFLEDDNLFRIEINDSSEIKLKNFKDASLLKYKQIEDVILEADKGVELKVQKRDLALERQNYLSAPLSVDGKKNDSLKSLFTIF